MIHILNFGPVNLGWRLRGPESAWQTFRDAYRLQATAGRADFLVDASIADIRPEAPEPVLPNSFMRAREVRGGDFSLGDGLVGGTLISPAECRCEIHPVLLAGSGLRVLEQFFYLLFQHTVRLQQRERQRRPFLLHCCAARGPAGAVIFCGPSGSGKSTIAALCRPGTVLTDECAIITPGSEGYRVSGSPVNPFFTTKVAGSAPLARVFLISHGDANRLGDVTRLEAVPRLTAEIMVPVGLLETEIDLAMSRALDLAIGLAGAATVKDLEFLPNQGVIELVFGGLGNGSGDGHAAG